MSEEKVVIVCPYCDWESLTTILDYRMQARRHLDECWAHPIREVEKRLARVRRHHPDCDGLDDSGEER